MIRLATKDDLPAMVALTEAFHKAAHLQRFAPWEASKWESWLTDVLASDQATCIVADDEGVVGMAVAGVMPAYWNNDVKLLREAVLFVDPKHTGKGIGTELIDELVDYAKSTGCQAVSVGTSQAMNPRSLGKLYRKLGFTLEEKAYIRRL